MRFTDIDDNFDVTYEGHQNKSTILSMDILRVFSEYHVMSKLASISVNLMMPIYFFGNLLHSPGV